MRFNKEIFTINWEKEILAGEMCKRRQRKGRVNILITKDNLSDLITAWKVYLLPPFSVFWLLKPSVFPGYEEIWKVFCFKLYF
jgi:hypothetical protein